MYYRDRFDIKNATANQIYDKIDLKYYDAEIDDIKKRISNIRLGRSEYYGYGKYYSQNVLTGKEAEARIKELEKSKKRIEKEKAKYSKVVSLAKHTEYELDNSAKKDALHDLFHEVLRDIKTHYDNEKRTYEESTFVEKYRVPIMKASMKDSGKFYKEHRKIDRKLYHVLKRNAKKMRLLINDNGLTFDYVIKESRFSIDGLLWNLYREKSDDYLKKPYLLGVDTKGLERAKEVIKEKFDEGSHDFCVGNSKSRYHDLEMIKNRETYAAINGKIYKFLGMYEDILVRGKELLALKCLLGAFSKTAYKDSESVRNLENVCDNIKKNIVNLVEKANNEYEKANLPVLIENYKKLEELYSKYLRAMRNHFDSKDANYSWSEYTREADEYRAEMYAIIRKYPELNRPEYKIEIDPKKKDVVSQQEPINNGLDKDTHSPVKTSGVDVSKPVLSGVKSDVVDVIKDGRDSRKLVTTYDGEIPKKVVADFGVELDEKQEDEDLRKPIEVPDYLSGNITVYYQQYMKEKLLKTELGKLKFSEFLEHVRPDLKELIEIERKREQRVETIYRKYLKYRISLKDKDKAMSFRDFAKFNYGLENYEIPEEYTETARKK